MKYLAPLLAPLLALLPAAIAQGIPNTGLTPCCRCAASPSPPTVLCTRVDPDEPCVRNPIKCPFDPEEQDYCCCCSPGLPAIACTARPKGTSCNCPKVVCDIPWDPERQDELINDL